MKALFGCLLCLVLTTSHTYAVKGGPVYPGGNANVIGRYAGVLVPPFCPIPDPSKCAGGLNSLGLFTLVIPQTGLGVGEAVIFSNGRAFTGTITGSANPNTADLAGVLSTEYKTTPLGSSGTPRTCATAGGQIRARIASSRRQTTSTSSILIRGTASVVVSCIGSEFGCPATCSEGSTAFEIDGFKQSNIAQ
jgi:hypothetical protein